jgi:hypothetical protein
MKEDGAALWEIVGKIYEKHRGKATVNPSWLATEAMVDIAFPRKLHELGYVGCHLQLRQIARSFCRAKFDPVHNPISAADDLFPETLQERYPRRPTGQNEEPEYVLLDLLSDDDRAYNVARMRSAALALQKHADALEADGLRRKPRTGTGG